MSGKYDQSVLKEVNRHWQENFTAPTYRWLMEAAAVSSLSVVADTLRRLEREGQLRLVGPRPVALFVVTAIEGHQPDRAEKQGRA